MKLRNYMRDIKWIKCVRNETCVEEFDLSRSSNLWPCVIVLRHGLHHPKLKHHLLILRIYCQRQNLFEFCFYSEDEHVAHKFSLLRFYNEWNAEIKFQPCFSLHVRTAIWMSHNAHTLSVLEIFAALISRYWSSTFNQLILRYLQFINVFRRHVVMLIFFHSFVSLSSFLSISTYPESHPEYVQTTYDRKGSRTPNET